MSTGKVALGTLAGLATGALLGILFAPEKGSVTRQNIANKGKDKIGNLKDRYNDVIEGLSAKLDAIKRGANGHFEDAMEYADDMSSNNGVGSQQ